MPHPSSRRSRLAGDEADHRLAELSLDEISGFFFGGDIDVPLYTSGIFGVILVLTMLFRPEGLIPSQRRKQEFHEGVHDQPLYDVTHE